MKLRTIVLGIILMLAVFFVALIWFFVSEKRSVDRISTFEECVENKFPVQESYPRRCSTPNGRSFTESLREPQELPVSTTTPSTHKLISILTPQPEELVFSPLKVTGLARGPWYFEASFPVELRDSEDKIIVTGVAEAEGEWMTEDFVPFSVTLNFENNKPQKGTLVFKKDNPSGLPEFDDEFTLNVLLGVNK